MSVLIFIDQADGHVKKAAYEAMSYGAAVAAQLGTSAEGVVLGPVSDDLAALGKYGVKKFITSTTPLSIISMRRYLRK
jgi:Electron transfer flavoprotein domain.